MMEEDKGLKYLCSKHRCNWHGFEDEVLTAHSPFDVTDMLYGCPKCKDVRTVVRACDEPDCWEPATCGFPTDSGYRNTCHDHSVFKQT